MADTKVLEHHALKSKPGEQAVIPASLSSPRIKKDLTLVLADAPKGSEQIDADTHSNWARLMCMCWVSRMERLSPSKTARPYCYALPPVIPPAAEILYAEGS